MNVIRRRHGRPPGRPGVLLWAGGLAPCLLPAPLASPATPVGHVAPPARAEVAAWRDGSVLVRREAVAMGTRLVVSVEAPSRAEALEAAEGVLREVARVEGLLSTWSPDTELGRLNRTVPGTVVRPSPELASILAVAETWALRTGRAFEPGVGALVDTWDLRGRGRRPPPDAVDRALEATGPSALRIDRRTGDVTRLSAEAWIDAGAFGKGAALAAVRDVLDRSAAARASVDLGGQILVWGGPPDPVGSWRLPVAHPARRRRPAALLRVTSGSVATSGASERGIRVGGERLGHLLDPRSGAPVTAWGSVTVLHDDPLVADILATALFVMGPEGALAWARSAREVAVLVLEDRDGSVRARWSDAMDPYLAEPRPGPSDGGRSTPSSTSTESMHPESRSPS